MKDPGNATSRRTFLRRAAGTAGLALLSGSTAGLLSGCDMISGGNKHDLIGANGMFIGAMAAAPGHWGSIQAWVEATSYLGPMTVRRSFHPPHDFPSDFASSSAGNDYANGALSMQSLKPPGGDIAGMIDGDYDQQLADFAATCPTDIPYWLTIQHEPENDVDGPTFVALHRHCYDIVKAANSNIRYGYIAMTYQWGPHRNGRTDHPADWDVGDKADWLGCDEYNDSNLAPEADWRTWSTFETSESFQRWYQQYAKPYGVDRSLPLLITEYGCKPDPDDPTHRPDTLLANEAYLSNEDHFEMWLYWHANIGPNSGEDGWRLDTPQAREAWNDISNRGNPLP